MTVSDQKTETWKPIPGAGYYEASGRGHIRSVDRTINGRFYKGVVLKPREDGDGYLVVNITMDDGMRKHGVSVARLVLLTHDPEGYRPGLQACHGPGGQKDNSLPNLRWDTDEANRQEALEVRLQNSPPKPKPLKTCPRCGSEHGGRGRNCHDCVVQIGVQAADMLAAGTPLDKVADELDYPPAGAYNLAVRYGALRVLAAKAVVRPIVIEDEVSAALREIRHSESPEPWLRRVINRWQASRRNSDAQ